jgi:hypothetical protein
MIKTINTINIIFAIEDTLESVNVDGDVLVKLILNIIMIDDKKYINYF